ncbi:MAG TPA: hypothetical protein VN962_27220 [Polyangia bacterium]|nr:hypothetical protein [Polyangia bacterium]
MSIQTNGPRDIVEGGPERSPNGQDESEQTGKRGASQKEPRQGGNPDGSKQTDRGQPSQRRDDVSYQPESGQPGAD